MKIASVMMVLLFGLIIPSSIQSEIRYGHVHKYYVGDVPYIADFTEYDYLVLDLDRNGFDDVLLALNDLAYFAFLNDGSGGWTGAGGLSDPYLKYLNGVCDCNGDGFDDFIGYSEYDDIAMGTHFIIGINDSIFWDTKYVFHYSGGTQTFWYPLGDFNGDEWTDFLVSEGWHADGLYVYLGADSCTFNIVQGASNSLGFSRLNVADINNDAYDDIVHSVYYPKHHNSIFIVFGGSGGLRFNEAVEYQWRTEYNGYWYSNYFSAADINGDGYDDIGVVERDFDEVNDLLPVYFHYSDGDTFSSACDTLIVPSERYAHLWSADFNGDGTDDLCYFSSIDTLAVYLGKAPTATLLRSFHMRFEQGRGVVIDWEVRGTEDCERFVISRSVGDEPLSVLAEVPVVSGKDAYSYTDRQVETATGEKIEYRLDVYEKDGSRRLLTLEELLIPEAGLRFYQNYPNPFNPGTRIVFDLPAREMVWLEIYDVTGRLVRRLVAGRELGPGPEEEFWDGRNEEGQRVSSGVYHCTLRAGKETISRKLVLIR